MTVSKSFVCGLPCRTVTSAVALGNNFLILTGKRGNWTIKVGSADATTLTVGASCPELPKPGVRNANGVVGKPGLPPPPPAVVFPFVVGLDEDAPVQALKRRPSKTRTTSAVTFALCCNIFFLLLEHWRGLPVGHCLRSSM